MTLKNQKKKRNEKHYKTEVTIRDCSMNNKFQKKNVVANVSESEIVAKFMSPRPPSDNMSMTELSKMVMSGLIVDEAEMTFSAKPHTQQNALKKKFSCLSKEKSKKPVPNKNTQDKTDLNNVISSQEEYLLKVSRFPKGETSSPLLPPLKCDKLKLKRLVIDLDETLIHGSVKPVCNCDLLLNMVFNGNPHQLYIKVRPHCEEFLSKIGPLFDCILFTAGIAAYANPVTDFIDRKKMFSHRLFREHCLCLNGHYVKDLSNLNHEVNKCAILDNSPVSYMFHPRHAIPIPSWFDDPNDTALLDLIPYLENLAQAHNVPDFISNNPPPTSVTEKNA